MFEIENCFCSFATFVWKHTQLINYLNANLVLYYYYAKHINTFLMILIELEKFLFFFSFFTEQKFN